MHTGWSINTSNHILDKLAYSIKEFQHISGLGRTTIYKAISIDKTLKVIKIGRRTLIPKQSVIDFLS